MIRRAPLYLVGPATDTDGAPLVSYDDAYGYIDFAAELWRLIGNNDRARAIEAVIARAYEHDVAALETADIIELRDLIAGLDSAIIGPLTDEHRLLSMERVRDLRGRTKSLDVGESRGELATHALSEAMVGVDNLLLILTEALQRGAHIAFD